MLMHQLILLHIKTQCTLCGTNQNKEFGVKLITVNDIGQRSFACIIHFLFTPTPFI